ncbi:MAG: hypothetical protein H6835_12135 [Planctomycetes bacterium]|nr:hypothetical protein [Planctomycetota bacterium]
MRVLLTVATLLVPVAAQERPPGNGEVAPAEVPARPAQPPKPAPLDKTLTAVLAEIAGTPHAFDGSLAWGPLRDAQAPLDPLDCAFRGGVTVDETHGEQRWHSLLDWTVLQRGARGATRRVRQIREPGREDRIEDTGWQDPQGDAPEVPLTPRLLLEQLPHATIGSAAPAEVDGRPAMRVLATWHGKAAKAAVLTAAVPSSRHEQLLETLATVAARDQELCSVCAEIRYDPATRRWLAATLRVLLVNDKPLPADEPPLPAPAGMPAPTGRPMAELIVTLRRRDPAELPPPVLDDRARELLQKRER